MLHCQLAIFYTFLAISACTPSTEIIFEDNFNTPESWDEALTQNATYKEYGENSMQYGHLLKKWNYSWDYSFEGDWKQAFYVVPEGKDYMEQAGRSGGPGNYRLIANTPVPDDVLKYEVKFRQWKNDNDPVFFLLGTDVVGDGGIRFGYENQLPGTDIKVDTLYTRGFFGEMVIPGKGYDRVWADHKISIDHQTGEVSWEINGELLASARLNNLPKGGYFAMSQRYERGTRYDDFVIAVYI